MNQTIQNKLELLSNVVLESNGDKMDIVKQLADALMQQLIENSGVSTKKKPTKQKNTYSIDEGFTIEHGDLISFDSRDYSDNYKRGDKPIWLGTIEGTFHGFTSVQTNKGFITKMLIEVTKDNGSKKKALGTVQALNLESMVNLKVIK